MLTLSFVCPAQFYQSFAGQGDNASTKIDSPKIDKKRDVQESADWILKGSNDMLGLSANRRRSVKNSR